MAFLVSAIACIVFIVAVGFIGWILFGREYWSGERQW